MPPLRLSEAPIYLSARRREIERRLAEERVALGRAVLDKLMAVNATDAEPRRTLALANISDLRAQLLETNCMQEALAAEGKPHVA